MQNITALKRNVVSGTGSARRAAHKREVEGLPRQTRLWLGQELEPSLRRRQLQLPVLVHEREGAV